jgi:hypothetical protein
VPEERVGLGTTLYRYRALSDDSQIQRVCESIRESYLYWASPSEFNDPFDMQPAYVFEPPRDCRRPFGLSYAAIGTSSSVA